MTVVAILGAGLARRFGSGKLEALLHGRPLGIWPVETALTLGIPVIYVTGPQPPPFLTDSCVTTITNRDPARGLGSSIALAARQARSVGAGQLLIVLGDMPFVSARTLQRLIDQTAMGGSSACQYGDGRPGPPACFGRDLFVKLEQLDGDMGGRSLLRDAAKITVTARELLDVDTAEQLADLNLQPPTG